MKKKFLCEKKLRFEFRMASQSCVSEAIESVAEALTANFVPKYLGFGHMSRDKMFEHVPKFTSTVFETSPEQLVTVMDRTYLFIDRPSDFALQRKTYSTHKHRNLIKTMMVRNSCIWFKKLPERIFVTTVLIICRLFFAFCKYILKFKRVREEASYYSQAQLWHERCAHMNIDYIRKTVSQGAISGISEEHSGGEFLCEGCALGKLSKLPHPTVKNKPSMSVGETLHADISGHIPTKSIGGASYMLLIKDKAFTIV